MKELNWDDAKKWQDEVNKDSEGGFERPEWRWDCSFKLDFDGPLLRVSSRFYPQGLNVDPQWEGTVSLFIFDEEISEKKFKHNNLEELRIEVEKYTNSIKEKLKQIILDIL
jgi:hypothetical protein